MELKRLKHTWSTHNYTIEKIDGCDAYHVNKNGKWDNIYRSLKQSKIYIAKKLGKIYQEVEYKQTYEVIK
jgi:hypothetical protein